MIKCRSHSWASIASTALLTAASGVAAVALAAPASAEQIDAYLGVPHCEQPQTQLCKQIPTVNVETYNAVPNKLYVAFTVNPNDCAAMIAIIYIDGGVVGKERVGPGQRSIFRGRVVSAGPHTVGVQAQGVVGGCNSGVLHSWGGTVHIKTPPGTPPQAPPPEPPELEPEEPPLEAPELGEFDPCRPTDEQRQGGKDFNDDLCLDEKTMEPSPPDV